MILEQMPSDLHAIIKDFDTQKMKKIMETMKVRIHFYKDMKNHKYFFTYPVYDSEGA